MAFVLNCPSHLSFVRATGSLTLDMLRRNGRRKAPRSAPHRAFQDRKKSRGISGVSNSNVSDSRSGSAPQTTDEHVASSSRGDGDCRQQLAGDSSSSSSNRYSNSTNTGDMTPVAEIGLPARGAGQRRGRSRSGALDKVESRTGINEDGSEGQEINDPTAEEEMGDHKDKGSANSLLKTFERAPRDRGTEAVVAAAPSPRPRSAPAKESTDGAPSSPVVQTRTRSDASATDLADSDEEDTSKKLCSSRSSAGPLLEDIELVNLHNLSLHKLEGMERLVYVRVADLSGNELHDTAPLRSCACLEVRMFYARSTSEFISIWNKHDGTRSNEVPPPSSLLGLDDWPRESLLAVIQDYSSTKEFFFHHLS